MAEGPSHFQPFDVVRFPPRAFSSFLCRLPPAQHVFYLRLSIALSRRASREQNGNVIEIHREGRSDATRDKKGPRRAARRQHTRARTRHGALDDAVTATDETRLPAKEKN